MAENETEQQQAQTTKRRRGLRWWAGMVMLAAAAALALLWLSDRLTLRSAEQQLAAIEAARAIPDSENAAPIYNQLFELWSAGGHSTFLPEYDDRDLISLKPWSADEHPRVADWLQSQQGTIASLEQACQKRHCWLGMPIEVDELQRHALMWSAMSQWQELLIVAANKDVGAGQIDAAVEKYRCVLQMVTHLCQQPLDRIIGFVLEAESLRAVKGFIVQAEVQERHLCAIEIHLQDTNDSSHEQWTKLSEMEKLLEKKRLTLFERLRVRWQFRRIGYSRTTQEQFTMLYHLVLQNRRGTRLLVALRRYKNARGSWPKDLGVLRGLVQPEILVDPINGGAFAYKLTQDGFTLYSKGKNNIDENGSRKGTADDLRIWPASNRRLTETIRYGQIRAPHG